MDPRDYIKLLLKEIPIFSSLEERAITTLVEEQFIDVAFPGPHKCVIRSGEPFDVAGLVLRGELDIIRVSYEGKDIIIGKVFPGEIFGEAYAVLDTKESPVDVVAATNSSILFMDIRRLIDDERFSPVVQKLLILLAKKNVHLSDKIAILSKKTIRERLMLYFSTSFPDKLSFTLPFTREELASYLAVDRSALSAELSRMKEERIIDIKGKEITLLKRY